MKMSENRVIEFLGKKAKAISLMQILSGETNDYPGIPSLRRITLADITKRGFQYYIQVLPEHAFQPHADAPNHQNPDRQDEGIEVFGMGYWFNSAVMIDLSNIDEAEDHDGANYLIEVTKDHLTSYRSFLSKRGAVIIRTGYDRCLEQNRQHKADTIPFLTLEAAEYIASFPDLKVVGIDSLTVDAVGKHKAHQALQNTMIVESIPHLHNIPSNNCLDFFLQTVPIRILGATGGPVVAIAYVPVTDN